MIHRTWSGRLSPLRLQYSYRMDEPIGPWMFWIHLEDTKPPLLQLPPLPIICSPLSSSGKLAFLSVGEHSHKGLRLSLPCSWPSAMTPSHLPCIKTGQKPGMGLQTWPNNCLAKEETLPQPPGWASAQRAQAAAGLCYQHSSQTQVSSVKTSPPSLHLCITLHHCKGVLPWRISRIFLQTNKFKANILCLQLLIVVEDLKTEFL